MNKSFLALAMSGLALLLSSLVLVRDLTKSDIVYVRSTELISNYHGMKEAQAGFEKKREVWKSNIDTLEYSFQQAVNRYNSEFSQLTGKQRQEREEKLNIQRSNLLKYSESLNVKAREEEEKMTQAVLDQVNSFVEEYGQKKGYTVILGTTLTGNLLYGEKSRDITQELLEELNASYTGAPNTLKK
jgi:outer membrane protein